MSLRRDGGFVSSRGERADEAISSELEPNLETWVTDSADGALIPF